MSGKKKVIVSLDDLASDTSSSVDELLGDAEANARSTRVIIDSAKIALEDADILDQLAEMGHIENDISDARSFVGEISFDNDGPSINGF